MSTVDDLLRLEEFRHFRLLAGKGGLNRPVSGVVILEYESEQGTYEDFSEGDFVLTSLFYAKDCPERIRPSFERLMERGVSAVAVKVVYYPDVPDDVKALAEEKQVPVFAFSGTYMEDVIIGASDYLREQQRLEVTERKVRELIGVRPPEEVLCLAREIDPRLTSRVSSVYLKKTESEGELQLSREYSHLLYRRDRCGMGGECFPVKYDGGLLILRQYPEAGDVDAEKTMRQDLMRLELDLSQYRAGMCDGIYPLAQLDVCIRESLSAFEAARARGCRFIRFGETGAGRFLLLLAGDAGARESCRRMRSTIEEYDAACHSHLMETISCYAACGGNIPAAAKRMYQHPNTVRYRLQKIASLLNCSDGFELEAVLFLLSGLMRLDGAEPGRKK